MGKDAKVSKDGNTSGAEPKAPQEPKAPAMTALASLGNIAEIQRKVAEEKKKLRLFVIKAKQEWEERQERGAARGETNDENYYMASTGEALGPASEYRVEGSVGRGVFSSVFRCR